MTTLEALHIIVRNAEGEAFRPPLLHAAVIRLKPILQECAKPVFYWKSDGDKKRQRPPHEKSSTSVD
jgi:hypothetical protein